MRISAGDVPDSRFGVTDIEMMNRYREFWILNQVRIVVCSFLLAFVTGILVVLLFPKSEFGAGVFGLVFAGLILIDTTGDLITGTTAMKDGKNQNITSDKNPIQFWMSIVVGVAFLVFFVWISCCAIARSI